MKEKLDEQCNAGMHPSREPLITLAAILALAQGALAALIALWGIVPLNVNVALVVICFIAFGIATMRRHLWAAWGLVALGLASGITRSTLVNQTPWLPWLLPALVYLAGAIELTRSENVSPAANEIPLRSILVTAIILFAGSEIIAFLFSFLRGFVGFQRSQGAVLLGALLLCWHVWAYASVATDSKWSFENIIATILIVWPLFILDLKLSHGGLQTVAVAYTLLTIEIGYGMIALCISRVLRVPPIQTTPRLLRTLLYPPTDNLRGARWAAIQGAVGAIIVAVVTALMAIGATTAAPSFSPWGLLDAAMFAVVGVGIYKHSRIASAAGLLLYIPGQIDMFLHPEGNLPAHLVATLALLVMFANGLRGTLAVWRLTASQSEGQRFYPHLRWKLYSVIVASFAIGVVALRVYESFRSPSKISSTEAAPEDLKALVKRAGPAVVTITTYDSKERQLGLGSGFFVSKDAVILTNHHVLEGATSAEVQMHDGSTHRVAALLADDPVSDLTEVIVLLDDSTPFLHFAHQGPEVGERIVVIGSPLGLQQTVSEGIVSAVPQERREIVDFTPATLQITAPISEGSSGGPVLNLEGEVVGVAAAFLNKGQGLNFAVPLERILVLKRIKPLTFDIWNHPSRRPSVRDLLIQGLASMKLGDCPQGLQSFRLAIEKKPDYAAAWWACGVCLLQQNATNEGIAALKKANHLDPSLALPHYTLGLIYARQDQRGAAHAEYETLKTLDSDLAKKLATQLSR
ncbi:MAG TPA: trypsin-like peptidase domain-containing protein [Candidatus Binataceae bacterium]|nr:trypsin-like peptidase domain-containing protein [Candidatus Binataceae bacterium]